jgi:hypothetical protein
MMITTAKESRGANTRQEKTKSRPDPSFTDSASRLGADGRHDLRGLMEDLTLWLIWIPAGLTLLVLMINTFVTS